MDSTRILFIAAVFLAVLLLANGIYLVWRTSLAPSARRANRRLDLHLGGHNRAANETPLIKHRPFSRNPALERFLAVLSPIHLVDRLLQQSGTAINVAQFLAASLGCAAVAALVMLFFSAPFMVIVLFSLAALGTPLLIMLALKRRRLQRIGEQLPEALDLMSRALLAGHALPSAMRMVGNEMSEPIAAEFRIVSDEVSYGISLADALKNLSARVPGSDLAFFVVAVLIQRETGGNLTEVMGKLAGVVRERHQLFGHIRVLSAEGRLSAWILSALPFALGGFFQIANPGFLELLWTDPAGNKVLYVVLGLMVVGLISIRRLVRIRV